MGSFSRSPGFKKSGFSISIAVPAGVPVVIGNKGIEKIVELKLNESEILSFKHSTKAVKELFDAAIKIDPDLVK